jgi:regulatory protein
MKIEGRKPGPAPDARRLREAALAHLARFAATEAGLARVLTRRVERWARAVAEAGDADADGVFRQRAAALAAIPKVIAELRAIGALDDSAYAESRARRLARAGKSRRATMAHLAAKGVDAGLVATIVTDDPAQDLAAACAYLRRRRLPPFGPGETMRALAALARAGFARDIADRALALDAAEAEALVMALRRGEG